MLYYLRDLEEQIDEYRRQAADTSLERRDFDVLEQIQKEESGGLKRRLATVLVDLGIKVDADAAVNHAASHEAA